MEKYRYRIRNKVSGLWSRGGVKPVWTADVNKAKVWDSKGSCKIHITNADKHRDYAKRYKSYSDSGWSDTQVAACDIENWEVQECRIVVHNTFPVDKFV